MAGEMRRGIPLGVPGHSAPVPSFPAEKPQTPYKLNVCSAFSLYGVCCFSPGFGGGIIL